MDYAILEAELVDDPLGRGYAAMTDADTAASLNAADRARLRTSMSGDEVRHQTDTTEFAALSDAKKSQWLAFCGGTTIDPTNAVDIAFVQYVFGSGSATVANLNAARQETVSRAVELGLGVLAPGDITRARAI
jgi:hypothetical protein